MIFSDRISRLAPSLWTGAFVMCSMVAATTLAATAQDGMPRDTVALFNGPCPEGWTATRAELYGRFLVAGQLGMPVGVVGGGDAISDVTDTASLEHKHQVKGSVLVRATNYALIADGPNPNLGKAGARPVDALTDADAAVPGMAFNMCRKTTARSLRLDVPSGVITATFGTCPAAVAQPYDRAEGRYILGWNGVGPVGRLSGGVPLRFRETRSHQHSVIGIFNLPKHAIAGIQGCCAGGYARSGAASFDVSTLPLPTVSEGVATGYSRAPYLNVSLCQSQ